MSRAQPVAVDEDVPAEKMPEAPLWPAPFALETVPQEAVLDQQGLAAPTAAERAAADAPMVNSIADLVDEVNVEVSTAAVAIAPVNPAQRTPGGSVKGGAGDQRCSQASIRIPFCSREPSRAARCLQR